MPSAAASLTQMVASKTSIAATAVFKTLSLAQHLYKTRPVLATTILLMLLPRLWVGTAHALAQITVLSANFNSLCLFAKLTELLAPSNAALTRIRLNLSGPLLLALQTPHRQGKSVSATLLAKATFLTALALTKTTAALAHLLFNSFRSNAR